MWLMILDLTAQKKAIYDWAKSELEMEFLWEEQNVHRPDKPYGTLKIIPGFIKIGGTDTLQHKSNGVFNVAGVREFTLSLNCYGDQSMGRANAATSSIEKPTVTEKFSLAGLVAVRCEQVQDLTRIIDNNYESRTQVDIRFRLTQLVEDDIGLIENVEVKNLGNDEVIIVNT
jgi:hypothetical protein